MSKPFRVFVVVSFLFTFFLSPGLAISSQEGSQAIPVTTPPHEAAPAQMAEPQKVVSNVTIDQAVICTEVIDRDPAGVGAFFTSDIGKLTAYTKVSVLNPPTEITHVWYFGETERGRVTLSVKAANWRTYSSKIIQPHEIGKWRVEILGPEGEFLKAVGFEISAVAVQ